MSWVAVGTAAASLISGISAKKKAKKKADRDRAYSREIEGKQLQIALNQDKRSGQLFEHYTRNFQPREAAFVKEAFTPITADAEEAAAVADVRGSLATARRSDEARERATGVNPASGAAASMGAARSLEEAKIEGGARTRARGAVRDYNFGRQRTALALANPGAAVPFSSLAQSGVGGVGSLAAGRSRLSDELEYEAGAAAGEGFGSLVDVGLGAMRNRPKRIVTDPARQGSWG
jgi:hypothetical protein